MMLQLIFSSFLKIVDVILHMATIGVTIVIAIYAYRISKGQLRLQKYQLKHDLYQRRYRIYEELKKAYNDGSLVASLKDKKEGIKVWLNDNEDHLFFLFEDVVWERAHVLYEELKMADSEYFAVNPNQLVVKSVDILYRELREEISKKLSFRNL